MNGSASPAVAFTATATAINALPAIGWRWNVKRDARHHQADHQHLVVHATHQMNDHQRVERADPQRGSAVGADVAGHPRRRPDQQHQPGQHAQPQHHRARDDVVADQHRDELGHEDERRPVRRGRRRPDRTDVVQQRIRIVDRADQVRVEAVAQQCALRQIGVRVAAEHRHAKAAAAPARSRWWPPSCTRVAEPSITRRPNHSHANSITATPPHSSSDESTRPWPKRSHDRCSDSSSGSCSRVLPAPSPPAVIIAAPRNAQQRGLAPPARRGERGQPRDRVDTAVKRTGWRPTWRARRGPPSPVRRSVRHQGFPAPAW